MQVEYWTEEWQHGIRIIAERRGWVCHRALTWDGVQTLTPETLVAICNRLRDALEQP